jgi:hypothetical protein
MRMARRRGWFTLDQALENGWAECRELSFLTEILAAEADVPLRLAWWRWYRTGAGRRARGYHASLLDLGGEVALYVDPLKVSLPIKGVEDPRHIVETVALSGDDGEGQLHLVAVEPPAIFYFPKRLPFSYLSTPGGKRLLK